MAIQIKGPYWDKSNQCWELRWYDGTRKRCQTSVDREELVELKHKLLGTMPGKKSKLKALTRFSGSATEFKAAIADATKALNCAARDNDASAVDLLRKYVKGLSEMASAIVPHSGYLELEQRHSELVQYVEDLFAGRATLNAEKPAALGSLVATLPGRAGSRSTVH